MNTIAATIIGKRIPMTLRTSSPLTNSCKKCIKLKAAIPVNAIRPFGSKNFSFFKWSNAVDIDVVYKSM